MEPNDDEIRRVVLEDKVFCKDMSLQVICCLMMTLFIRHVVAILRLHTERHLRHVCHHAGIALCDNRFQAQFWVYSIAVLCSPTPSARGFCNALSTWTALSWPYWVCLQELLLDTYSWLGQGRGERQGEGLSCLHLSCVRNSPLFWLARMPRASPCQVVCSKCVFSAIAKCCIVIGTDL